MEHTDFIKSSSNSSSSLGPIRLRRPFQIFQIIPVPLGSRSCKRILRRAVHQISPVIHHSYRNLASYIGDSAYDKATFLMHWHSLLEYTHMVAMIMSQNGIVQLSSGHFRKEMTDVINYDLAACDVSGRFCRSQWIAMTFQLLIHRIGTGRINQQGCSVRKDIEEALASSCIDGMDFKPSFLPS